MTLMEEYFKQRDAESKVEAIIEKHFKPRRKYKSEVTKEQILKWWKALSEEDKTYIQMLVRAAYSEGSFKSNLETREKFMLIPRFDKIMARIRARSS